MKIGEATMSSVPFADRSEAGRLLAAELAPFANRRLVVFGLPRCGVPVAYEIAQHLGAPLDVVLVRTVRAPDDRSRLLATVLEGDPPEVRIEPDWDQSQTVSRAWLDAEVSEALHEIDRRRRRYRYGSRPVSPAGRVAIVVDQAIGRGHAMAGAIRLIRDARPSMIVAATPVASEAGPSVSPAPPTRWSACAARPSSARSTAIMAGHSRSPTKKRWIAWRARRRASALPAMIFRCRPNH
jgi:putative phosphoribosyl transferase